jgi:glycosyltransferase involved in cell wall biosynthesis
MRICLYTWTFLPKLGGQELVVDALARAFTALGHPTTVLAPRQKGLTSAAIAANDQSLPYPVVRHPRFISTQHFLGWYARYVRAARGRHPFDILHAHEVHPSAYVALCAAGWDKAARAFPVAITSHGGDVKEGNARLIKPGMDALYRRVIHAADALISISDFTDEGFTRLGASPAAITRIPNGVDLTAFAVRPARPASLPEALTGGNYHLYLGRLKDRKGVDLLLQAYANAHLSTHLAIAGTGEEEAALKSLAASLPAAAGRVHFLGRVTGDTKTWLLQNARAVVMPSTDWEAFPLVPLEAYAAGVPVIGTTVPGLKDLLDPSLGSIAIPPNNLPALTAALQATATGTPQARTSYAAGHAWPDIAQRHVELFNRLIQK